MTPPTDEDRIRAYLNERAKMRGLDPEEIHGLHVGNPREVALTTSDLRALLSERAELLATVERLETALIQKADEGMLVLETLAALSPNHAHRHVKEGLAMARQARAALTTGEATNAGERG